MRRSISHSRSSRSLPSCCRAPSSPAWRRCTSRTPTSTSLALTRFGLTAERCVFFDDTAKNIVGANEVGIHGILFENALQARESLAELGVRL